MRPVGAMTACGEMLQSKGGTGRVCRFGSASHDFVSRYRQIVLGYTGALQELRAPRRVSDVESGPRICVGFP